MYPDPKSVTRVTYDRGGTHWRGLGRAFPRARL